MYTYHGYVFAPLPVAIAGLTIADRYSYYGYSYCGYSYYGYTCHAYYGLRHTNTRPALLLHRYIYIYVLPTVAKVRLAGYGWAADVYYDNDAMDRKAHQPEWMAVS